MSCNTGFSSRIVAGQCIDVNIWSEYTPTCTSKSFRLVIGNIYTSPNIRVDVRSNRDLLERTIIQRSEYLLNNTFIEKSSTYILSLSIRKNLSKKLVPFKSLFACLIRSISCYLRFVICFICFDLSIYRHDLLDT